MKLKTKIRSQEAANKTLFENFLLHLIIVQNINSFSNNFFIS
jgi:hypothetical protein